MSDTIEGLEGEGLERGRAQALDRASAILSEHFHNVYIVACVKVGGDSITYFRKNCTRAEAIGMAREAEWIQLNRS